MMSYGHRKNYKIMNEYNLFFCLYLIFIYFANFVIYFCSFLTKFLGNGTKKMAALLIFIAVLASMESVSASKPNVLFILVDDLGWTDVSHHSAEYDTPNIDSLYKSGIELTNYYVHLDCTPTRASVLTGKYAWKTGLQNIGTIGPGTTQHIPYNTPTVAELMKSAGYDTYGLGKWHLVRFCFLQHFKYIQPYL